MFIIKFFDDRVKKLGIIDLKLLQGAVICVGIILVKIFPDILKINISWFIIAAILLILKPMYAFFIKK
ncbi:MAG: hypothetical protein ABIJ45_11730 [Candidatus Zixiibacteriota bacterium]